jgi:hypothetical protein
MQLLALGVIVIVALTGIVPAFTAENAGISPVPLLVSPMAGLLLVQENVVPAPVGLVTGVTGTDIPLQ